MLAEVQMTAVFLGLVVECNSGNTRLERFILFVSQVIALYTLTGLFILIISSGLKEQLTSMLLFLVLFWFTLAVVDAQSSPGIHMEVTETCQIYQQLLISGSSLIMTSGEADGNNRRKMWSSVIWKLLKWRPFCTVWCWNVRNDWGQIYSSSSFTSVFHLWVTNTKKHL